MITASPPRINNALFLKPCNGFMWKWGHEDVETQESGVPKTEEI
jgi:hypothetical protein